MKKLMTKTASEVIERIEREAEERPEVRVINEARPGYKIRQGDVYLEFLAVTPSNVGPLTTDRQLAPGSTQGSRHVAEGDVTVYAAPTGASALTGPVIVAKDRWTLTHPEHAHFDMPAGTCRVTFQRDHEMEEIARVRD
ncbi:MAG: hypothetical protein ACYTF7_10590 [Planctomycetota bacterium]|jgi:hypothetical protein